ncbi:SLAM family member 9-like [Carassius auratus]|uniref:SLAM family member 9-like n=1 Tax=Carassius auratus TaxID=7957 RepID=A0A6P6N507_CARAU|nr:SLAM family member 9-like [Carassius auratus]
MPYAFLCFCLWLLDGVSGDYSDEMVISVMEGDSVTLNTDVTEIQRDDLILWTFILPNSENRIAEIYKQIVSVYDNNERFRDRLKIDEQTGSLTVTNINKLHSGLYKLQIMNGDVKHKSFNLAVYGVFVAVTDEVKSVSVLKGDSVSLNTDVKVQRDYMILWRFGPQNTRIAEIIKRDQINFIFASNDGRFRDKLLLDNQTGSLTIRNIRSEHSELTIISEKTSLKSFSVTVYAPLPSPVITSNSSNCSSSSSSSSKRSSVSNCSLLCSVVNVSAVTLSWYKGNSLLSSISVSDLSISLSLPLEVEYQENNIYSCVINNPITNQTQHNINITQLCHTCPGTSVTLFIVVVLLKL